MKMLAQDERRFWHNPALGLNLMQAHHVEYAYPRHSHDQFVICVIEHGVQSFMHKGTRYVTPPSGLILINPGVIHTGEAATERGFMLRSLYPSLTLMETAVYELTGRRETPFFRDVRVDDPVATASVQLLHRAFTEQTSQLEQESRLVATLAELISRFGEVGNHRERPFANNRRAVDQAREYLEAYYDQSISLNELAAQVALSPYHLLRLFHREVGLPPHAYLQDVRVRRAQQLIEQKMSLAQVALAVGFNSQSHMTRRFKQIVGITPGQYAAQIIRPS